MRIRIGMFAFVLALFGPTSDAATIRCSQVGTWQCTGETCGTPAIQWDGYCSTHNVAYRCVWVDGQMNICAASDWYSCNCAAEAPYCDCLLEGAPITLADGSVKPVELIQAGDLVLAYDELSAGAVEASVVRVHKPYDVLGYVEINEEIRITEGHPMLRSGKWINAGDLKVGDQLTTPDGGSVDVYSVRRIDAVGKVYNFQVSSGTYVAHGVVVHNKEDCEVFEIPPCAECWP